MEDRQQNKIDTLRAISDARRGPAAEDLAAAPLLNPWRLEYFQSIRIHGRCEGHPFIDDPFVTTSPLIDFDPDAGWARTRSRWYRIGPDWQTDPEESPEEMAEAVRALRAQLARQMDWLEAGLTQPEA